MNDNKAKARESYNSYVGLPFMRHCEWCQHWTEVNSHCAMMEQKSGSYRSCRFFTKRIQQGETFEKERDMGMKSIIDVCCGGRMFYFNKHDKRVLFCDKRELKTTLCDGREFEVAPDIVADFTDLPFDDNTFHVVVFDPPHLKNNNQDPKGYQHIKYGSLKEGWEDELKKGFAECFRVLKPNGVLIFKWNETEIKVSEILKLTDEKPLFGHKSGKASKTHWITFIKDDKEVADE